MEAIKLTKPIMVGESEIAELQLREPKVEDVEALGVPYAFTPDGMPEPKPAVMSRYISRLAGIPPSAVRSMSLRDYQTAMFRVASFFGQ